MQIAVKVLLLSDEFKMISCIRDLLRSKLMLGEPTISIKE